MSSSPSGPIASIWQKWKSLKLPWRRRWLAGEDLAGNKYWYFKPTLATPHARRILQNNPKIPYSDLNISPMWHQWLRHTRTAPPSLQEQQADVVRQIQLKKRVQLADARWNAKPSVLDKPRRGNQELGVGDGEREGTVGKKWEEGQSTGAGEKADVERDIGEKKEKENPWKQRDRGVPGQAWQPEAWTPGPVRK